MRITRDLSALQWRLTPFVPYLWMYQPFPTLDASPEARPIPARVPGSVQRSLRDAGLLPDWNVGEQARLCEWVENRHWIYEVALPDEWFGPEEERLAAWRLLCAGLDYSGWVYLNGARIGEFRGSHTPHTFDLTERIAESGNILRIIFDLPPRWLGQFGHTSRFREWKPRFNYTWDWVPRLVQVGFTGPVHLEKTDGAQIASFRCSCDAEVSASWSTGMLRAWGRAFAGRGAEPGGAVAGPGGGAVTRGGGGTVARPRGGAVARPRGWSVCLSLWQGKGQGEKLVRRERVSAEHFTAIGFSWCDLPVQLWQPNNGEGRQPLYTLECELFDPAGNLEDRVVRSVGFRHVEWHACERAPAGADPWLCVVNGTPTFLQGVNYPPVLPNWADVKREHHRRLLESYRDLGANVVRINGCGYLESEDFYELCDELGILVWQEFPLSSSGVDNIPPEDPRSIAEMSAIARSFIASRQHHPSLLMWGGGNELLDPSMKPYDLAHPMLSALAAVAAEEDPGRRFVPTSPSGPRWTVEEGFVGKGLHWDVHGPWKPKTDLAGWEDFWSKADALFYSEIGAPGAAPAELIRRYAGELAVMPVDPKNPLFCLTLSWWTEDERFKAERGRPPKDLEEYVAWSQDRQARALAIAVKACKDRFPACGGVILWCGHDCFPCAVNTSILDFEGKPKPAALALKEIWRR